MLARNILRSQRGNISTVLFLFLLPVMVMYLIVSLDHTRAVFGTDLDMQQALNDACRSAALMVDPLSQAHNDPMINPDKAHDAFKDILSSNLKLNEDLKPKANSSIANIEYVLIVCNGGNDYGLPEGMKYTSAGDEKFSCSLPITFSLSELGVEGDISTVLDQPGCVAAVTAILKPIMGKRETLGARWSAAKILQ
jgi:hypothetical protein